MHSSLTLKVRSISRHLKTYARLIHSSNINGTSYNPNAKKTDFLTLKDYSGDEIKALINTSAGFKHQVLKENKKFDLLDGKSIALMFEKKSTRTRLSMEGAMALLGGYPMFLSPADIHLGVNESLLDTARVMSLLVDCVFGRVYNHDNLVELAREATVPVINGLSEYYHPLQSLADFLTLYEHFGSLEGKTLSWVGDGNNIVNSLLMTAPKLGMNLRIATPKGYEVEAFVKEDGDALAKEHNTSIYYTTDAMDACTGTNVIVTDTWISMGQEEEYNKKVADFKGYQVNMKMGAVAADNWCFLHCLPRKSHEVDDEVFYSDRSLAFQEAGNRKWTAMAVLAKLLANYEIKDKYISGN